MALINVETRFNEGDEVFFMNYETPAKAIIIGIRIFIGNNQTTAEKFSGTLEKPIVVYDFGSYRGKTEDEVFKTKEELFKFLEAKIK